MSFQLPFKEGDTVVELGGGERPILKNILSLKTVNVDIRQMPGVDIVRNLEGDFSDIGEYDGVFANYLLEHISWRKVPHFIEECYKIMKPSSYAVFVVPDTYAQAQKILTKKPEGITLEDSSFLFGGQDFPDNTHKWFLSRPLVESLFLKAGFERVEFVTHPGVDARDMFVTAYKGASKRVEDESSKGPLRHGMIDVDVKYALPFKEGDRVIELGGGDNPLKVDGLTVVHVDARQLLTVDIVRDVEKGFGDLGEFDGLFSSYMLEHISWRNVERFLSDCYKVLKPSSHAVFLVPETYEQLKKIAEKPAESINFDDSHMVFGVQEHDNDYHKWLITRPLLEKMLLKAGFQSVEFTTHPDPKARDVYVDAYKGEAKQITQTKLNLGSFTITCRKEDFWEIKNIFKEEHELRIEKNE